MSQLAETGRDATVGVLEITGLSKDYGPVRVVDDVSLSLAGGSIHALLGENGAGKSTLIKMLSGAVAPTVGSARLNGQPHRPASVQEAQGRGLVALPQELMLIPSLDVADNIFLGRGDHAQGGVINRRRQRSAAGRVLAELGQDLPLSVPAGELSPVQQTMVAIARALVRNARVLILDEPTAALTDAETTQLFDVLRSLRDAGVAIMYVSHRLEEVFLLADTATVMRNGRVVWTRPVAELDRHTIVEAMIGRSQASAFPARTTQPGDVLLEVDRLNGNRLIDVGLDLRAGEVLGVAGLAGAGRSELLRILAGAQRPRGGRIRLGGRDLAGASVAAAMRAGVALVPEERRRQGLILTDTIGRNIALANLPGLSSGGVMSRRRERQLATASLTDLRIKAASIDQPVDELSGGNQQKVVLAKYLQRQPRLLLLDEPTRGIDVGTKAEIYALIRTLAERGVAVIVVSSEIPELLGLCDDILVLREGRVSGRLVAADCDEKSVLTHCYFKPEEER